MDFSGRQRQERNPYSKPLTHKLVFYMLIGRLGNVLSLEEVSQEKSNE